MKAAIVVCVLKDSREMRVMVSFLVMLSLNIDEVLGFDQLASGSKNIDS